MSSEKTLQEIPEQTNTPVMPVINGCRDTKTPECILGALSLSESVSLNLTLLEMSAFPISITRLADARLLMVNKVFCKVMGCRSEDVIGHTLDELNFLGDSEAREKINALLDEHNGEIKDYRIRVQRGKLTPADLSMWIKKLCYQGQDCVLTSFRYSNEKLEAQHSMRGSDARFQTILNSINESYYEIDLEGKFTFFNNSLIDLMGSSKDALTGMPLQFYTCEEGALKINRSLKAVLSGEKNINYLEFSLHRQDGQVLEVETSMSLIRGIDSTPSGFYGIVRDRTEQKRSENALRRSEEKYRRILEEMEEGYYENDLQGNYTNFNDAIVKIYGYPPEELMGMNYTQYLRPERAQMNFELWRNMYKTGKAIKINDVEVIRKDGSVCIAEASSYPLRDENGRIVGSWGIIRDRTEQKMAQKALQKREEQYRLLVNNANDGIYITQQNRIKFHNPKMIEMTGYTDDELQQTNFVDLVHPEDMEDEYIAKQKSIAEDHSSGVFSFRIITKNKQTLWVELSAIGITWEGQPAMLNFLRDVTDHKKTETRLLQAQKMEAIGTLAGGIAHDFNNILSAIIGYTELAKDDVTQGSKQEDNLKEVLNAGSRARDLVHQILAFARQSDEKLKPVMVSLITKEALKLMRSSIPATIEIQHNITSNATVMGNPTQIHQILINLCTNAAHAMEKSGGLLSVDLMKVHLPDELANTHAELAQGDYLKLSVADTGCGIPPEILHTIFDPYFTTKSLGEGTGMGLSVVQGIVEKYGGKITVRSQLGKGTTFTVLLPVCNTKAEPIQKAKKALPIYNERILWVDDETTIVKMSHQILEKLGYQVTSQTDSLEALRLFRSAPENFDLVITDMTMPNMTGDQMAGEMLRIRPDLPVILCTGYSKRINEEIALQIGIKAFIYKPISKDDLAVTVRKVLDGNTAVAECGKVQKL